MRDWRASSPSSAAAPWVPASPRSRLPQASRCCCTTPDQASRRAASGHVAARWSGGSPRASWPRRATATLGRHHGLPALADSRPPRSWSRRSSRTSRSSADCSPSSRRGRRGRHPRHQHLVDLDHGHRRRAARGPSALVGMHFFNPAPLMALVEVVSGVATDPDVADDRLRDRAPPGARARCTRSRRPASSSTACARPFYAEGAARCWPKRGADAGDARRGDARGRRLPHGAVRADGPDRPRRQLRGHAVASSTPIYQRPALHAVADAAGAGRRPASSAARAGAASTDYGERRGAPGRPTSRTSAGHAERVVVRGELGCSSALLARLRARPASRCARRRRAAPTGSTSTAVPRSR